MSVEFEIAKKIIEETCPKRKMSVESIRLFSQIIKQRKCQKGEVILNEGEICNCLFYIEKGMTRQHYVKRDKDVTEHLACEKEVVWCIKSYFNQTPTNLLLETIEPSILWEIPKDAMEKASDQNSDIAYLYRSFFENSLMLSQLKADILRFESANERYTRLSEHFPEIVKRAPLTLIASYLQMSLETLSRVRASIVNSENN